MSVNIRYIRKQYVWQGEKDESEKETAEIERVVRAVANDVLVAEVIVATVQHRAAPSPRPLIAAP